MGQLKRRIFEERWKSDLKYFTLTEKYFKLNQKAIAFAKKSFKFVAVTENVSLKVDFRNLGPYSQTIFQKLS